MRFNSSNNNDLKNLRCTLKKILNEKSIIVCIGTNRDIADSMAPFVGMILEENGCRYKVYGTIDKPVHALNLREFIDEIKTRYPEYIILAIDAGLDESPDSVGDIILEYKELNPGSGVGKKLSPIGDLSIIGIVGSEKDLYNEEIRLNTVIKIAKSIASSIL